MILTLPLFHTGPEDNQKNEAEGKGKITVYSKPGGNIILDGKEFDKATPGTIEATPGKHKVQVRFFGSGKSDVKTVRVKANSRIKLFFRADEQPSSSKTASEGKGKIKVYSNASGKIILDGHETDQLTPGTIHATAGRHNVQVLFDGSRKSGTKTVRLREDSVVKLFFMDDQSASPKGKSPENHSPPVSRPIPQRPSGPPSSPRQLALTPV